MNKIALAFTTRDKVELSNQTVIPLLEQGFDLWCIDGSDTLQGKAFALRNIFQNTRTNILGGADAAAAYALTVLLDQGYEHVGLVESDVLLHPGWFAKTMELFERGREDGLRVGAVSARCYEDRVLIQRDGYAIMHNLGFGQVILTRQAAQLALKHFRTGFTTDNRLLFSQLSGIDIAAYWAFRGSQNFLCADWGQDKILAAHGLASLALTPSPVEMIGQVPSLEEQGLKIVKEPTFATDGNHQFELYRERTAAIRSGEWQPSWSGLFHRDSQGQIIFPHQIPYLGGRCSGDWTLKWAQGYGPFAWQVIWDGKTNLGKMFSETQARVTVPVLGPCDIMVSGGPAGGKVRVVDHQSGFEAEPELYPEGADGQVLALSIPNAAGYREVELTALSPGVVFYGLRCREQQPVKQNLAFEHSWLPPVG